MNVRNEFRAIIRGGEHVVQVHDDKSLMIMFSLNSNAKYDIVVQVMEIPTVPLQVMYEDEQEEQDEEEDEENEEEEEDEKENEEEHEEQHEQ